MASANVLEVHHWHLLKQDIKVNLACGFGVQVVLDHLWGPTEVRVHHYPDAKQFRQDQLLMVVAPRSVSCDLLDVLLNTLPTSVEGMDKLILIVSIVIHDPLPILGVLLLGEVEALAHASEQTVSVSSGTDDPQVVP